MLQSRLLQAIKQTLACRPWPADPGLRLLLRVSESILLYCLSSPCISCYFLQQPVRRFCCNMQNYSCRVEDRLDVLQLVENAVSGMLAPRPRCPHMMQARFRLAGRVVAGLLLLGPVSSISLTVTSDSTWGRLSNLLTSWSDYNCTWRRCTRTLTCQPTTTSSSSPPPRAMTISCRCSKAH